MVLDDTGTSEFALRCHGETYICVDHIKFCVLESLYIYGQSFPVFIFCCGVDVETWDTSGLTAVTSHLSNVGELIFLGLWYTLRPGSFGGGHVLGEFLLKHDDFWVADLDGG